MPDTNHSSPEFQRLAEDDQRKANWKRWGPYLAERQWSTVREDYSANGDSWNSFPHEQARSRAYRWGEDGLLGITDRECRLCFALALWNSRDSILKERLFGLTNPQGNHGEDVKECYYYIDSTPTHSWMAAMYRYPQARFPYEQLVAENARRGRQQPEFEPRRYGRAGGEPLFQRPRRVRQGRTERHSHRDHGDQPRAGRRPAAPAAHALVPQHLELGLPPRRLLAQATHRAGRRSRRAGLTATHATLERFHFAADAASDGTPYQWLFTDNVTNSRRLFNTENLEPFTKDAFHRLVIEGEAGAVNSRNVGTKVAAWYKLNIPPSGQVTARLRLYSDGAVEGPFGAAFDNTFAQRKAEADQFYAALLPELKGDDSRIARGAYSGLLWNKQFFGYVVEDWLEGDPETPPPPVERKSGRNSDWPHLFCRDVLSMPDKWEYPWFAAWDLAFHTVALARLDPVFAREQLSVMLREWYMHPNGQLPAYEFDLSNVNPPVHAWACWEVYKATSTAAERQSQFLSSAFLKLLMNFTWWVNRKDLRGKHLFSGGFLGLDNIGVFDRSRPLPGGGATGTGRRHSLDGILLRQHVGHGLGAGDV